MIKTVPELNARQNETITVPFEIKAFANFQSGKRGAIRNIVNNNFYVNLDFSYMVE